MMRRHPAPSGRAPSEGSAGAGFLTFTLYITTVFLFWTSLYLYLPTFPVYAKSKTESLALVGVILSMYGLWQALVRLPLGILADWVGRRKPFILAGFVLAGLGAWYLGVAEGAGGLIIGRSITGLAASTWVLLVVAFTGLFPPSETVRASAMLTFVGSLARVLISGVNGTLNNWGGYRLAFFVAAGAAGLAVLIFLPAAEPRRSPKAPSVSSIGHLLARRDILLPSLLSAVTMYANWTVTFGFIPILAGQIGATDVTISVLTALYFCVVTVGNLLATTMVRGLGARRLVYVSFILMCMGIGAAALASTLLPVFAGQFCIGLSMGIGYPVLMGLSIQQVEGNERATAMGLHQSLYAVGMFAGPILSGPLADIMGIRPMFALTAFVCLVVGVIGARWLSDLREKP
jgi:MFS family permease